MTDRYTKKLNALEKEIKRMTSKMKALREAVAERKYAGDTCYYHCPKESGAVRRASLDLSRALSEFRRPWPY